MLHALIVHLSELRKVFFEILQLPFREYVYNIKIAYESAVFTKYAFLG